jgi:hypothetical protein
MIVPAGLPIWSRTATTLDYGGHPNKKDYLGIGAVNAQTDVTAAQLCRLTEDAAAIAMMSPLFMMYITAVAGSPITFTVQRVRSLWGANTDTPYAGAAPPTGFPQATNVPTTGDRLHVIPPVSASDAFGVTGAIIIRFPFGIGSAVLESNTTAEAVFVWSDGASGAATIWGY